MRGRMLLMEMMIVRIIRHILTVLLALLLLVGVSVCRTGYIQRRMSSADAVSSATTVIEQPSGAYVVLINRSRHPDEKNLAVWEDFFMGREIGILFEDISCTVAGTDAAGIELARSFQSRLPENQMSIRREDMILMRSKADHGLYDVMLMSKEVYEASGGSTTINEKNDMVIESAGAEA